jgi:membrane-bound metal-dependent hydrolase YbcI (DUF457 family)
MPFPLAHGLFGATLVAAIHPKGTNWKVLLPAAAVAISPDLDLLLLWVLHIRGVHRGFSHSVTASLVVAGLTWAILGRRHWVTAAAFGLACFSHAFLDFAAAKAGGGVMLLWPFSHHRFKLGIWGFGEMTHPLALAQFLRQSLTELFLFTPPLLGVLFLRRRWYLRSSQAAVPTRF